MLFVEKYPIMVALYFCSLDLFDVLNIFLKKYQTDSESKPRMQIYSDILSA